MAATKLQRFISGQTARVTWQKRPGRQRLKNARLTGPLRPVSYCSRSLTASEKGYAQIEKELLATVWVCEKFNSFLQGIQFKLQTDHKPLIPLINTKILSEAPIRCQRLLMRLARYTVIAEFVPGKFLVVADTLSRNVMSADSLRCESSLHDEIKRFEIHFISALPVSRSKLQIIRDELKLVKEFVTRGWDESSRSILPEYFSRRSELTVIDDLLLIGGRIVIPQKIKLEMLHR